MSLNFVKSVLGAGAPDAGSGLLGGLMHVLFRHPSRTERQARPRTQAITFVCLWLLFNWIFGVYGAELMGYGERIAWQAHVGGFAAGLLLFPLFRGRRRSPPRKSGDNTEGSGV